VAFGGNGVAAARRSEEFYSPAIGPARAYGRVARPPAATACPELDCIRHALPPWLAADAERRAANLGIGADRVLIAANAIDEEHYLEAFAGLHGLAFDRLVLLARDACPLDDRRLIEAAATGLLPLRICGELIWVVAPRVVAARQIARLLAPRPELARRIRITTPARLRAYADRHTRATLGDHAVDGLRQTWPNLSSAPRAWCAPPFALLATLAILATAAAVAPAALLVAVNVALAIVFLTWTVLRLVSIALVRRGPAAGTRIGDDRLPVYTVICALYREARSVRSLVASLAALDYPPEKLQVILVLERDDIATRVAIDALALAPPFEIVTVPDAGPRTKPKALNAALPFARGTFTVVYDAEDRPEPGQLRAALAMFRQDSERLGCVQAALTIDNMQDSMLTRMFTAEYAGQFDVFLPGLAALRLPLPLGGSSNHFRTATLRAVGAWDPYNVTEDADLGMRLARFGYRIAVVPSTTFEEAPARLGPWLRQRTRWLKGWMQTWLVHMREPRMLVRDLGPAGMLTFQLVVGGNVLAPLVQPIFVACIAYTLMSDAVLFGTDGPLVASLTWLFGITIGAGYLSSIALGALGLRQRGLLATAWVLVFTPIHWLLLSLAAWRALFQLLSDPYRWEKTEHGLARTSRRGRMAERPPANASHVRV
jgi:cellulose synthase/poly-beta-1,6-N-acetylglucosamine synthase-like glycosyltransferase